MALEPETQSSGSLHLPLVNHGGDDGASFDSLDVDAELKRFEEEEKKRLGLEDGKEHWRDEAVNPQFTASERKRVTVLVCGLTMAHDLLVEGAMKGLGYNVKHLDVPDNEALRFGKEFGNRGQCNPTYFTVGNVVKYLCWLRDEKGMTSEEIIRDYVFLTAGACGPCRFGMYVTEYRKALRDAGFDGFRVLLFQQTGGVKQATGEENGLKLDAKFFFGLLKGIFAGDVLNAIGYRLRPYEVEAGSTDAAIARSKEILYDALANQKFFPAALLKVRKEMARVKIDRLNPKPKVSIIGEFWAMTTEGDGNYHLQKFLNQEGAECDIQLVAAWILYMIWQAGYDTRERMTLRGQDKARQSLKEETNVPKKLATLWVADKAVRGIFQGFAHLMGLYDYHLPDMKAVADAATGHYDVNLRGGEGHMEVGKLVLNVEKKKVHMTLSVKPFGCMPSSGVSDGVQSLITEKYPEAIYLPIETSGDGAVNVYSRVQMMLFKARKAAKDELEKTLEEYGVTADEVRAFVDKNPQFSSPLHKSPHRVCGTGADLVHETAPLMKMSRLERWAAAARSPFKALYDRLAVA
jgi:predicted nucleotide-binding protein (sugar kinase/HSP70/actin superfamily)